MREKNKKVGNKDYFIVQFYKWSKRAIKTFHHIKLRIRPKFEKSAPSVLPLFLPGQPNSNPSSYVFHDY